MDGRRVLVLDAGYRPVNVVSWEEAFTKIWSDPRVRVIEHSADGAVVGVHRDVRVPSVIVLGEVIVPHKQRIRFCRRNVIIGRDQGRCQYCGNFFMTEELSLDHVLPRALGGKTCWENVVAACIDCNQKKAARTPEQAGMTLLKKPVKPKNVILTKVKMNYQNVPKEWSLYWDWTLQK